FLPVYRSSSLCENFFKFLIDIFKISCILQCMKQGRFGEFQSAFFHALNIRSCFLRISITGFLKKKGAAFMNDTKLIPELYGSLVFNDKVMRERLPKDIYKALHKTIQNGTHLELDVANVVAAAMKE